MTWPYEVRRNGVLLEQIDGAVHFDGLACLVEAKAWTKRLVLWRLDALKPLEDFLLRVSEALPTGSPAAP